MGHINLRAMIVGIVTSLLIAALLAIVGTLLGLTIFGELAHGVNFANEVEVKAFIGKLFLHPAIFVFVAFGVLVCAGIPAYLAAFVAKKNFVLHSMLIGSFTSLLTLTDFDVVIRFPALVTMVIIVTLVTSYAAGYLRRKQSLGNIQ